MFKVDLHNDCTITASSSVNTSDVLNDILKLPQHSIKKTNRKPGFNKQAICITNEKVMKELEEKAKEKKRKEQE